MKQELIGRQFPEGTFKLKDMPQGSNPGIQRQDTESEIRVSYQNRFTLFDDTEQIPRQVLQEKTIAT